MTNPRMKKMHTQKKQEQKKNVKDRNQMKKFMWKKRTIAMKIKAYRRIVKHSKQEKCQYILPQMEMKQHLYLFKPKTKADDATETATEGDDGEVPDDYYDRCQNTDVEITPTNSQGI